MISTNVCTRDKIIDLGGTSSVICSILIAIFHSAIIYIYSLVCLMNERSKDSAGLFPREQNNKYVRETVQHKELTNASLLERR